jgi:hypothetical protein
MNTLLCIGNPRPGMAAAETAMARSAGCLRRVAAQAVNPE